MTYKIQKGKHYAEGLNFKLYPWKTELSATVTFDSSALYDPNFANGYNGFSKLFGLSYPFPHWISSMRFGWRSLGERGIEIVPYVYDNGERIYRNFNLQDNTKLLLEPNQAYDFHLEITEDYYVFVVKGNRTKIARTGPNFFLATLNVPYFGGQYPAPKDIYIDIQFK